MIWTRELHEKFVRALNHLGHGSKNFFTNSTSVVCLFLSFLKRSTLITIYNIMEVCMCMCMCMCMCGCGVLVFFWQRIMTKATTT